MKLCWLDMRGGAEPAAGIREEAIHQRLDGIVAAEVADLVDLPPTMKRILFPVGPELPHDVSAADIVVVDPAVHGEPLVLAEHHPDVEFARFVDVRDAETLEAACDAARTERWSVLRFRDPTKIPLEIVIAAAARAEGGIVTEVADVEEAGIVFGVLEHGSDGVLMAPEGVGDATALREASATQGSKLDLVELEVTATAHVGMGERACVDTCTYFGKDEGILVGSHSKGMVLCVSETHPLPYMPTRPFRVNAGAIHSYTLSENERTRYLSELGAGSTVLAVDVEGRTRPVVVGRVKIERRPLISVDAVAPDGTAVNLILQDDWHVRVLGPAAAVLNSTELRPGNRVLGYLPTEDRHVGYPIDEFCMEH